MGGLSRITAQLDGATHVFDAAPEQSLLAAAEAAGLSPPYSCREGNCAACMCTLVEGDVELVQNQVLDEADLRAQWILSCQALPRSAAITVRWPD